jgi:hypothetical protein
MKNKCILNKEIGTIAERRCRYGHAGIKEPNLSRRKS